MTRGNMQRSSAEARSIQQEERRVTPMRMTQTRPRALTPRDNTTQPQQLQQLRQRNNNYRLT
eukprot:2370673-Amphidinium_carterae.1